MGQNQKGLDDVIFLNFETISFYMENELYQHSLENKRKMEQHVKTATTYAASCAWMVGKEWAIKDLGLRNKLRTKDRIGTGDVPADALELLTKAVYFPYWLFAGTFSDYYDSSYGRRVRHQRNGHLKDTYQGLVNGMLMCFLAGVKSQ